MNTATTTETTAATLTHMQIVLLSAEAMTAGDYSMVTICDRAVEGDREAREECAEVINAAEAMNDEA